MKQRKGTRVNKKERGITDRRKGLWREGEEGFSSVISTPSSFAKTKHKETTKEDDKKRMRRQREMRKSPLFHLERIIISWKDRENKQRSAETRKKEEEIDQRETNVVPVIIVSFPHGCCGFSFGLLFIVVIIISIFISLLSSSSSSDQEEQEKRLLWLLLALPSPLLAAVVVATCLRQYRPPQ